MCYHYEDCLERLQSMQQQRRVSVRDISDFQEDISKLKETVSEDLTFLTHCIAESALPTTFDSEDRFDLDFARNVTFMPMDLRVRALPSQNQRLLL